MESISYCREEAQDREILQGVGASRSTRVGSCMWKFEIPVWKTWSVKGDALWVEGEPASGLRNMLYSAYGSNINILGTNDVLTGTIAELDCQVDCCRMLMESPGDGAPRRVLTERATLRSERARH